MTDLQIIFTIIISLTALNAIGSLINEGSQKPKYKVKTYSNVIASTWT